MSLNRQSQHTFQAVEHSEHSLWRHVAAGVCCDIGGACWLGSSMWIGGFGMRAPIGLSLVGLGLITSSIVKGAIK